MRHILSPTANMLALLRLSSTIRSHGMLIYELGRRDITDRYVAKFLGLLWAFINPALQLSLYVFLFTFVFRTQIGTSQASSLDAVIYIIAGLISWFFTVEVLNKSVELLPANVALLKQIVFPVEVLPLKTCLAGFFIQSIYVCILLVVLLATMPQNVPVALCLLPAALAIQLMLLTGISFLLSLAGAAVRDLKDIVQFLTTTGLFLTPILYSPAQLGHLPRPLFLLIFANPFSHIVWCYQDAIYFAEIRHGASWIISSMLAVATLAVSFRVFLFVKPYFGERF